MFAADAVARLTGARRGRGHRRPRRHQHHHRAQERPARAVAGGAARRRHRHRAQGPRRAAGHRPDGAGAPARQVATQVAAGARPGAGARARRFRGRAEACRAGVRRVPGRSALRRGARCASGTEPRRGAGGRGLAGVAEQLLPAPAPARACSPARRELGRADRAAGRRRPARRQRCARAAALLARAERPVLLVGSQALLDAPASWRSSRPRSSSSACRSTSRAWRAGCSGVDAPLQLRHRRSRRCARPTWWSSPACRATSGSTTARQIGRQATLVAANRSRTRLAQEPPAQLAALARSGALPAGPRRCAWRDRGRAGRPGSRRLRARDAGARGGDRRPGRGGERRGREPAARCAARSTRRSTTTACSSPTAATSSATASYIVRPRGPLSLARPGRLRHARRRRRLRARRQLARPGAEVWMLCGDGSAGYSLAEFDTFVRHGMRRIAVVGNDASWTQIAREQVEVLEDDVGTVLAPPTTTGGGRARRARLSARRRRRGRAVLREALRWRARDARPTSTRASAAPTSARARCPCESPPRAPDRRER